MDVHSAKRQGFTLIEVLFAVLVLSSSLAVLLGMQSSVVRRILRDRGQRQAMLMARSIMSALEIHPESAQLQDTTKPARELLDSLIEPDTEASKPGEEELALQAHLLISPVEIPVGATGANISLKQIRLTIFWGAAADETLQVFYYLPIEEELEE